MDYYVFIAREKTTQIELLVLIRLIMTQYALENTYV